MTSAASPPSSVCCYEKYYNSGESKKSSKQRRAGDPLAKGLIMRGVFHGRTYFRADRAEILKYPEGSNSFAC